MKGLLILVLLVSLFMFSIVSVEATSINSSNRTCVFKVAPVTQAAACQAGGVIFRSNQTQKVNIKINFTQDVSGDVGVTISNKSMNISFAIINSNGTTIVNKSGNLTRTTNSTQINLRNTTVQITGGGYLWEMNYTLNLTAVLPGNFTIVVRANNSLNNSPIRKYNFTLKDVRKPSVRQLIESPTGGAGSIVEIRLKVEDVKGGIVSKVYVNLTSRGIAISPKRINLTTNDNKKNGTWAANFTLPINTTAPIIFTVYSNDSRGIAGRIG